MNKSLTKEIRFLRKMNFIPQSNQCIEWHGKLNHGGYGMIRGDDKNHLDVRVHRISYEIYVGKIPKGYVIDHKCRNRKCVNPQHLRTVTRKVNNLENSINPIALNLNKTKCLRGHPFNKENTRIETRKDGRTMRRCKKCRKLKVNNNK